MITLPPLESVYDPTVSESLDTELRELLSDCFQDACFRHQRFKYELPAHRWILRDETDKLCAHVGLHAKRIQVGGKEVQVAGIAEVCVREECRGHGWMRYLLEAALTWSREQRFPFSALFGDPELYARFGYLPHDTPIRFYDVEHGTWVLRPMRHFLILPLGENPWPEGEVHLQGPKF